MEGFKIRVSCYLPLTLWFMCYFPLTLGLVRAYRSSGLTFEKDFWSSGLGESLMVFRINLQKGFHGLSGLGENVVGHPIWLLKGFPGLLGMGESVAGLPTWVSKGFTRSSKAWGKA